MRCAPSDAGPLPLLYADESLHVPRVARGDVGTTVAFVDTKLVKTFVEDADPRAEGNAACGEAANMRGGGSVATEGRSRMGSKPARYVHQTRARRRRETARL